MNFNKTTGELIIYDEKFSASTSQSLLTHLEGKGQLNLAIENGNWKTFTFMPNNGVSDDEIISFFVFRDSLLKSINISTKKEESSKKALRKIFTRLINDSAESVNASWGSIDYGWDYKNSNDSIAINYAL